MKFLNRLAGPLLGAVGMALLIYAFAGAPATAQFFSDPAFVHSRLNNIEAADGVKRIATPNGRLANYWTVLPDSTEVLVRGELKNGNKTSWFYVPAARTTTIPHVQWRAIEYTVVPNASANNSTVTVRGHEYGVAIR
jgi:hypothetical protein